MSIPSIPTITTTLPVLSRQMSSATFTATANDLFSSLPAATTEQNAAIAGMNVAAAAIEQLHTETQAIKDAAVSETQAIKDAAVSETQAIKDAAALSAGAAATRAAEAAASANFRGAWASLTGPLSIPSTVLHSGTTWQLLANLPDVSASEPGVSEGWAALGGVSVLSYESRGDLRTAAEIPDAMAIVDGLGLFIWRADSDEPDDDESCFATTNGRWLLEAAHWDIVDAWQLPELEAAVVADEDISGRFLTATRSQSVTSVAANTTTTAEVTVTGAKVGDTVIVTRSGVNATSPQGNVFGVVTAENTVTIYLCADNVTSYFHAGTWRVTVIKPE